MKRLLVMLLGLFLLNSNVGFAYEEQNQAKQPEFTFTVVPNPGPEKVQFDIILQNNKSQAINFEFPTAQKYELEVKDAAGKTVYRFSEGKSFAQMIENLKLAPDEVKTWTEEWDYRDNGKRVGEGEYKMEASLKVYTINGQPVKNKENLKAETSFSVPGINPVFKEVKATGKTGKYTVSGQTRPIQGEFYYTVEDGHNQYIGETKVTTKNKYPNWETFTLEINIPKEKLPSNATLILNLYEKKDEEFIHTYPVILERFNH